MRVIVKMAATYDSIQSIAFQIPGSGERVLLPCRLICSSERQQGQALGIEFLSEDDSQLLLIEKFIEDCQLNRNEERKLPRTSCHLEDVIEVGQKVRVVSIENLSADGLLLNYVDNLQSGETLQLSVGIPGDERRLILSGTVMYVMDNVFRGSLTAGLRLSTMKEIEERRLRNLILACANRSAMRDMHEHLSAKETGHEYQIDDPELIDRMFHSLQKGCVRLSTLVDGSFTILEHEIEQLDQERRQFAIRPGQDLVKKVKFGEPAYFSFFWSGGSHYFKTHVNFTGGDLVAFPLPPTVFRSNKRSYQRKPLRESTVCLMIEGGESERKIEGTLLDISRRGFLCEVHVPNEIQALFKKGNSIRYEIDEQLGLGSEGQIRHLKVRHSARGLMTQVGIEAGIARATVHYRRIQEEEWEQKVARQNGAREPERRIESVLVRFEDSAGHEICGLINATKHGAKTPVVIIPSAYGKTKESLSPLVATLLENFLDQEKSLVTLRYDGINRPGESHQSVTQRKPGYEMLSYRLSQGLSDLQAAVNYVNANPYFIADRVIIVSFSLSAIEARKLLSQGSACGADYWISCMGVPCAQTTLRNILGGMDVISNFRLGIPNGTVGLLGHLIDMDIMAADLLSNKYAFMTDARLDMSQIDIPVLWIYGLHDKWVDSDEVKDLMSVKARGRRGVLEIPTGHNLRTSSDAIRTFKLITSSIYEELYGEKLSAREPSPEQVMKMLATERERLENRDEPDLKEYWRGYLMGNERNKVGYDFYRNIPEFTGFIKIEIDCLGLGHNEVIADIGCGTGIVLEELLGYVATQEGRVSIQEIMAVDLVQEALEKAKSKCDCVVRENVGLQKIQFKYEQRDLEPNRLNPVADLMGSKTWRPETLRNRVAGLSSKILDSITARQTGELDEVVRGAFAEKEYIERLKRDLDPETFLVVMDLNRAARFLKERIVESDIKPERRGRAVVGDGLRTSDLVFDRLDFGDFTKELSMGFCKGRFSKLIASLFISYLRNPGYFLRECHAMLKAGGTLVVSSMRPDSDISVMFTDYIRRTQGEDCREAGSESDHDGVWGARDMLNEAASLFELEEAGFFRFYTCEELTELLSEAGFNEIAVLSGMGKPAQANIAIAKKGVT